MNEENNNLENVNVQTDPLVAVSYPSMETGSFVEPVYTPPVEEPVQMAGPVQTMAPVQEVEAVPMPAPVQEAQPIEMPTPVQEVEAVPMPAPVQEVEAVPMPAPVQEVQPVQMAVPVGEVQPVQEEVQVQEVQPVQMMTPVEEQTQSNTFIEPTMEANEPVMPTINESASFGVLKPPTEHFEEPNPDQGLPFINNDSQDSFKPIGLDSGQTLASIANEHRAARVEGPIDLNHDGVADQGIQTEPNNPLPPPKIKKKKKGGILIYAVIGLALFAGISFIYINNPFGDNLEGEPKKSNNKIEIFKDGSDSISGVYSLEDDKSIIVCQNTDYSLFIFKDSNDVRLEYGIIDESGAKIKTLLNDYKITFKDDTMIVDTEDTNYKAGIYELKEKIDIDKCYSDFIGDPKYLEDPYNGIYQSEDNNKILLYRTGENTFYILSFKDLISEEIQLLDKELGYIDSNKIEDPFIKIEDNKLIIGEDHKYTSGEYERLSFIDKNTIISTKGEYNSLLVK